MKCSVELRESAERGDVRAACPRCGNRRLTRVPRRCRDRLLHLVRPVYRFHCETFGCEWGGTLRQAYFSSRSWHRVLGPPIVVSGLREM